MRLLTSGFIALGMVWPCALAAAHDKGEVGFLDAPIGGEVGGSPVSGGPVSSLSSLTNYHSLLGAPATLYLCFTGETNHNWFGYDPGTTPAYDTDGDPTTFSAAEQSNIQQIWMRAAEKYSPFNIDVTTQNPGNLNDGQTLKVVIGGDGSNGNVDAQGHPVYWAGGRYGGIGWIGGFTNFYPNIVYSFAGNLGNGTPKYVGESIGHESGHGFGLNHQSVYSGQSKIDEYSTGTYLRSNIPNPQPGSKSPMMGNSYYADRGIWWSGPSSDGYNIMQDDLSVIASENGFGYRQDDHGNTPATASALDITGSDLSGHGVIEQMEDKDYFGFNAPAGLVSFIVRPAQYGGMLDVSLEIRDLNDAVISQHATDALGEMIFADVGSGTYELVVSGAGNYGDVGQYSIIGAFGSMVPEPTLAGWAALGLLALRRRRG